MVLGKARETVERAAAKVTEAASDTKRSLIGLGIGLIVVAVIALAALLLGTASFRRAAA
jgi:hypothetical protein